MRSAQRARLVVFENIFEFFLQPFLGKDIFDTAPRSLIAALAYRGFRAPFRSIHDGLELLSFLGLSEKLFINVEMLVVAFTHLSEKPYESIAKSMGSVLPRAHEVRHYNGFGSRFNCQRQNRRSHAPKRPREKSRGGE
jgi:hypothetical protein